MKAYPAAISSAGAGRAGAPREGVDMAPETASGTVSLSLMTDPCFPYETFCTIFSSLALRRHGCARKVLTGRLSV